MGRVPNAEKDKMVQDLEAAKQQSSPDSGEEDKAHRECVDRIVHAYSEYYGQTTDDEVEGFRKFCSTVS